MTVHNLHAGDPEGRPKGEGAPQLARIANNVLQIRKQPNFEVAERNMQLRGAVLEAMRPLEEIGYSFATGEIRPSFEPTPRLVTLLIGGPQVHHVAQLPTDVASSDTYEARNFFLALVQLFPDGCSLLVVAHEVDALPLVPYNTVRQDRRINVRFVPWRHLHDAWSDERSAAALLLTALNLDAPAAPRQPVVAPERRPEPGGPRSPEPPEPEDRDDLELIVEILAGDLEDARNPRDHFSDFVDRLGLADTAASDAKARWNENVKTAAKELVKWADHRGTLTLGRVADQLLVYLPGRHQASELLAVVERRRLVRADRLVQLRAMVIEEQP